MRITLSEGYSPRNLGDAELVDASLDFMRSRYAGGTFALVALDTDAFRELYPEIEVLPRLFDRRKFARGSSTDKLGVLLQWVFFISAATLCSFIFPRVAVRRWCKWLMCPQDMRRTFIAMSSSDLLVPVGGGYLGDRYSKESFLTLWSWWLLGRVGVAVETMPVSVEADRFLMKFVLRIFGSRVLFTVRDQSSLDVLRRVGHSPRKSADLAFRNATPPASLRSRRARGAVVICPVGSDYYPVEIWKRQWDLVADELLDAFPGKNFVLLSMHRDLDGIAGHDDEVVEHLHARLGSRSSKAAFTRYADLCVFLQEQALFVVSARMHAGIAALCANSGLILLGYEKKHESLMQELERSDCFAPFHQLSRDRFRKMCVSVEKECPETVSALELKTRLEGLMF